MMSSGTTVDLLRSLLSSGCTLRLFANNVTPTALSKPTDFKEPGNGYLPEPIYPNQWVIREGVPCEASTAPTAFKFNAPGGTIFGLYLTRGEKLLWAERFKEPQQLINQNDQLEVNPVITAS